MRRAEPDENVVCYLLRLPDGRYVKDWRWVEGTRYAADATTEALAYQFCTRRHVEMVQRLLPRAAIVPVKHEVRADYPCSECNGDVPPGMVCCWCSREGVAS